MKGTLEDLRKEQQEVIAGLDATCKTYVSEYLSQAWKQLQHYFLRHPDADMERNHCALALRDIESAIAHIDRVTR